MFKKTVLLLALAGASLSTLAGELRVLTHSSFSLPKDKLAEFEKQAGVKLSIIKAGDAGEMLNKLILTRANPIADVVYGIDNTLIGKANAAGVLEPTSSKVGRSVAGISLPGAVAVDYGYVNLNIDKAWFAKQKLALPASLDDLAKPAYKDLLVVENPATSSPGLAFLLATIAGKGEAGAFQWWAKLRDNGVKVAKGWSEAYYTDFSRNGGARPIVVSYATSPAAEVFYSKEKLSEAPTANLLLAGGVFQQIEGVAKVKGGKEPQAAQAFVDFLRGNAAQQALPTEMWMYPAVAGVSLDPVFKHAQQPQAASNPKLAAMQHKTAGWVSRWTRVVLKSGN
ncbi:thiamine ABC transporter substrate binding subunit [Vogesella facilis]|uniref:Thiamine ABC transporter substrate binding subunit n=1 Tax=Vogesella facilis TaxID=1655232 RepID=A0ABV7RJ50_9NEIS